MRLTVSKSRILRFLKRLKGENPDLDDAVKELRDKAEGIILKLNGEEKWMLFIQKEWSGVERRRKDDDTITC